MWVFRSKSLLLFPAVSKVDSGGEVGIDHMVLGTVRTAEAVFDYIGGYRTEKLEKLEVAG